MGPSFEVHFDARAERSRFKPEGGGAGTAFGHCAWRHEGREGVKWQPGRGPRAHLPQPGVRTGHGRRPVAGVTDCGWVSGACGAGARRPACRAGGRGRGLLRWQPWFPESAVRAGGRVASLRASAVRAGAPAKGPGKWEGASPHFLSQSDAHELCPRCPHAGRPARASRVPAWSAHPAPGDRPLRSSYKSDGDVIQVERHS